MDLSGAADPAQAGQFQQQAGQGVMAQRAQADRAVAADFGENNIYPTVPAEMLQSAYQPGAAGGGGGGIVVPLMPAAAGAALIRVWQDGRGHRSRRKWRLINRTR